MIKFIRKHLQWFAIFLIAFVMFYPSLFGFFTNDEFFLLKIAKVSSFHDFLNFFNLVKDTVGIGAYRPLTLRVYYFLSVEFFHLNPFPLHIISFLAFFLDIFLVGLLTKLLTKSNKIALLSSFLYTTSVTHFGHLYYTGGFQELFVALMFLGSLILFIKYEIDVSEKHSVRKLILSFILFILALMSKETAVVLPFILVLIHFYLTLTKRIKVSIKALILSIIPYIAILGIYLFLHFRYFGLVAGDSYVWNFSPLKALNTLSWYGLWSLNIPEMLVDFVGPGIHLNPNLLKYWSGEIIPIFILFIAQVALAVYAFIRTKFSKETFRMLLFAVLWFVITLAPVLFLPVHKFTFYLVLPLFGTVIFLSYLMSSQKRAVRVLFCVIWLAISLVSLHLSVETNWITQGQTVAYKVYQYFKTNEINLSGKNIYFVDTKNDMSLPWSPTQTLETVLADKNFFEVFYPGLAAKINYSGLAKTPAAPSTATIESRQFLGY